MNLKAAKRAVIEQLHKSGFSRLVLDSNWRGRRLLILGYHGFSMADEHLWSPGLYMEPPKFRGRLQVLRDLGCAVLRLDEALERLKNGLLPPRSVAITIDDGSYDFFKAGWPILKEFGYPATVYLTTYYSEFNRPVFDTTCSYIVWKAIGQQLDWPEMIDSPVEISRANWHVVVRQLLTKARDAHWNGKAKDEFLRELGRRVSVDYDALAQQRFLTLMNPEEVRQIAREGVDVQLHTHRHRAYRDRDRWLGEIQENQSRVEALSGRTAGHFCYPSGFYLEQYPGWLREAGVRSAATCFPGFVEEDTNLWLLPRLMDTSTLSVEEFQSWITGIGAWLPRRQFYMDSWPLSD